MNITLEVLLLVLGVMTFLVNVIVEVTKDFGFLQKIKTNYYVTGLSLCLSVLSYFIYISYSNINFVWYYFISSIIVGFIVAYLSMFGWDKLISQWKNSSNKQ